MEGISKEVDLQAKSNPLWERVERTELLGGYSYTFRVVHNNATGDKVADAKAFAAHEKINNVLFPAVVPSAAAMQYLDSEFYQDSRPTGVVPLLWHLGYGAKTENGEFFLTLPGPKRLLHLWDRLRESESSLPKLRLWLTEDPESDKEFAKAFLQFDAIVSLKGAFVHDHTVHLITLFRLMGGTQLYQTVKERVNQIFQKRSTRVEAWENLDENQLGAKLHQSVQAHLPVAWMMLGVATDTFSAVQEYESWEKFSSDVLDLFLYFIWENDSWSPYLSQRLEEMGVDLDLRILNGLLSFDPEEDMIAILQKLAK